MKTLMKDPPAFEVDYKETSARGESFFVAVLSAMDRVAPGQTLRIQADFEPALLYSFMADRGFERSCVLGDDGTWRVDFLKRVHAA